MREAVAQRDLGNGIAVEPPLQLTAHGVQPEALPVDAGRHTHEALEVFLEPAYRDTCFSRQFGQGHSPVQGGSEAIDNDAHIGRRGAAVP